MLKLCCLYTDTSRIHFCCVSYLVITIVKVDFHFCHVLGIPFKLMSGCLLGGKNLLGPLWHQRKWWDCNLFQYLIYLIIIIILLLNMYFLPYLSCWTAAVGINRKQWKKTRIASPGHHCVESNFGRCNMCCVLPSEPFVWQSCLFFTEYSHVFITCNLQTVHLEDWKTCLKLICLI